MNTYQQHPSIPFSFDIQPETQQRPQKRYRDEDDDDDEADIHPRNTYASYLSGSPSAGQQSAPYDGMGYSAGDEDEYVAPEEGAEDDSQDPYASLTSQALNPDGTPKRPMNAFMIFARKRRPEIALDHPTLRTGEISKILSKEWQSMEKGDKQFFVTQAKKLKDEFNGKYPDYVYKRRPNNSRKKRKGSNATRPDDFEPEQEEVKPMVDRTYRYEELASPSRRDSAANSSGYGDQTRPQTGTSSSGSSSEGARHSISSNRDAYDAYNASGNVNGFPGPAALLGGSPHRTSPPQHPSYRDYSNGSTPNPSSGLPYNHQTPNYHHASRPILPMHTPQESYSPYHPTSSRESFNGAMGASSRHRDSIGSNGQGGWLPPAHHPFDTHGVPSATSSMRGHPNPQSGRSSNSVSPVTVGGGQAIYREEPGGPLDTTWQGADELVGRTIRNDSLLAVGSATRPNSGTAASIDGSAGSTAWMVSPASEAVGLSFAAKAGRPHSSSVSSSVGRPNTGSVASGPISRPHSSSFNINVTGRIGHPGFGVSGSPHTPSGYEHPHIPELQHHQQPNNSRPPNRPASSSLDSAMGHLSRSRQNASSISLGSQPTTPSIGSANQPAYAFPVLTSPFYPPGTAGSETSPTSAVPHGQHVGAATYGPIPTHPFNQNASDVVMQQLGRYSQPPQSSHRFSATSAPDVLGGHGGGNVPNGAAATHHNIQNTSNVVGADHPFSTSTTMDNMPTTVTTPPTSTPPTPPYGAANGTGSPHGMVEPANVFGQERHYVVGHVQPQHIPGQSQHPQRSPQDARLQQQHYAQDHYAFGADAAVPPAHNSSYWESVKSEPAL